MLYRIKIGKILNYYSFLIILSRVIEQRNYKSYITFGIILLVSQFHERFDVITSLIYIPI